MYIRNAIKVAKPMNLKLYNFIMSKSRKHNCLT